MVNALTRKPEIIVNLVAKMGNANRVHLSAPVRNVAMMAAVEHVEIVEPIVFVLLTVLVNVYTRPALHLVVVRDKGASTIRVAVQAVRARNVVMMVVVNRVEHVHTGKNARPGLVFAIPA